MTAHADDMVSIPRAELDALRAENRRLRREAGAREALKRIRSDPLPGAYRLHLPSNGLTIYTRSRRVRTGRSSSLCSTSRPTHEKGPQGDSGPGTGSLAWGASGRLPPIRAVGWLRTMSSGRCWFSSGLSGLRVAAPQEQKVVPTFAEHVPVVSAAVSAGTPTGVRVVLEPDHRALGGRRGMWPSRIGCLLRGGCAGGLARSGRLPGAPR